MEFVEFVKFVVEKTDGKLQSSYLHLYVLFRNFAPLPDEETGSAEEQPASNMAVPTLEAVFQEPLRPWAAF